MDSTDDSSSRIVLLYCCRVSESCLITVSSGTLDSAIEKQVMLGKIGKESQEKEKVVRRKVRLTGSPNVTILEFIFPPKCSLLSLIHFIYQLDETEERKIQKNKIYGRKQTLRIYVRV